MKKGHIFFISWVSWAGKWTLITNLKKLEKELNLTFLKSYVTRPIREGEIEWNIYYFISKEEFEKSIKNNEFIEYFKVYGLENYYWTKYKDIIDNWINLWKIIIKEIDMNWLLFLKLNYPELKNYCSSIFLDLSLDEQLNRIKSRWVYMSEKELEKRKETAINERKMSEKECDYIIDVTNKSKEENLNQVLKIINEKIWKSI